jgi:hypothetical protein
MTHQTTVTRTTRGPYAGTDQATCVCGWAGHRWLPIGDGPSVNATREAERHRKEARR